MKQFWVVIFLFWTTVLVAQAVPFIDRYQIDRWKALNNDTVYVINFWATWCAPCVEELPAFEKLNQKLAREKVRVVLVSNDFKKHVDTKLASFIREKGLKSDVVWMNESNPNNWVNRVNPDWSGSIPATLILGNRKSLFFEKPLTYRALKKAVRSVR
jgi:thiol-disulfide isomerase/thioredoxin